MTDAVTNETLSQFSELVRYSRSMLTIAGVITLITMIVGVVGNSLTIVALVRHSKIRTVAAAFIASLCISDLLICFLVLPFAASQFFHGTWIHGNFLCVIVPFLRYGSVGVSLLSVAMISINRYILIAWPELYNKVYTKVKVCIYIGSIWLIAYGVQLPTLAGVWGVFGIDENLGTCSINRDKNGNTPKISLFVIGFALPCIVIIVSYAKIYCVVRKSNKRMESHVSITKKSEMHITKMVLVIFFCFVICYLPLTLVKVFDEKVRVPPLHVIGYLLLYLAACINPIVDLKDLGSTIDETDRVCHLLLSLPSQYDTVITALETVSEVKMDFVKARLLDEELKHKSKENIVLVAANFYNQKDLISNKVFVLDSGASNHFVKEELEKYMVNVKKLDHAVAVHIANGQILEATKQGEIRAKYQGKSVAWYDAR
ncbi:7 transmembrane receptor (rhodopsin family) [Popillia japonica]|uniref:7 transmembrane receptor (Rhodopsin family) n=1 Tax=Popillia japonica TaxID=7064 RepID=A0AAW1LS54_POPJA